MKALKSGVKHVSMLDKSTDALKCGQAIKCSRIIF